MQQVGDRIRELREGRGWTRVQLGVYAGVSTATVSLAESGQRTPNAETLVKLAHAFGVDPGDLFRESAAAEKAEAPDAPKENAPSASGRPSSSGRQLEVEVTDTLNVADSITINVEELRR